MHWEHSSEEGPEQVEHNKWQSIQDVLVTGFLNVLSGQLTRQT
jgi:hypothetical protein